MLKINSNISSLNAQKNLNRLDNDVKTPLQRLSSGKRINSAKDDAAGLAIAARMATQILGTNTAIRNTNDGISLSQVAEGALQESSSILQRIRELAVQSGNATNSPADRRALQDEVSQLTSELNRISGSTEFNGKNLLDGSFATAMFQVGANPNQTITATTANFQTDQYGNYQVEGAGTSVAAADRIAASGSLNVSGATGSATVNYSAGDSAKAIADSVNQVSEQTGVKASASTDVDVSFGAAGSYSLNLTANNGDTVTVGFNLAGTSGAENLSQAVTAFNDHSATTGVTASVNADGTGITLTHNEGESITLSDTTSANAGDVVVSGDTGSQTLFADATADTAVATGQVTFGSEQNFSVSGVAGDVTNTASVASQLQLVAELDISNVAQANNALAIVDSAIASVSSQRASFGALQSRFESSIRNSENYSVNLSASRSRIEDTDYAKETSELTRSLILKQSGMAMLGQANMVPQLALKLLGK